MPIQLNRKPGVPFINTSPQSTDLQVRNQARKQAAQQCYQSYCFRTTI